MLHHGSEKRANSRNKFEGKTSSLHHSASDYRLLISTITWSGKSMGKLAREMYTIIDDKLYRFAYRLFAVLHGIGWSTFSVNFHFSFFVCKFCLLLTLLSPRWSARQWINITFATWLECSSSPFLHASWASDCNVKKNISRMTKDLEGKIFDFPDFINCINFVFSFYIPLRCPFSALAIFKSIVCNREGERVICMLIERQT